MVSNLTVLSSSVVITFFLRLYLVDEYSLFSTYEYVAPIGRLTLTIRKNITTAKASASLSDESDTATILPVTNATVTAIKVHKLIDPVCSKFNLFRHYVLLA